MHSAFTDKIDIIKDSLRQTVTWDQRKIIMVDEKEVKKGAVECRGCAGTGNCSRCKGEGIDPAGNLKKCRRCGGTGICPGCKGSGWLIIPISD